MIQTSVLDLNMVSILLNSFLTVIATIATILSLWTSHRLSKLEGNIKQTEFSWKTKRMLRRELVAKLRIVDVLESWEEYLVQTADIPDSDNITKMTEKLRALTDEYGEIVPEAVILYNELNVGTVVGASTDDKVVTKLANRVIETIRELREDIEDLKTQLGLPSTASSSSGGT